MREKMAYSYSDISQSFVSVSSCMKKVQIVLSSEYSIVACAAVQKVALHLPQRKKSTICLYHISEGGTTNMNLQCFY